MTFMHNFFAKAQYLIPDFNLNATSIDSKVSWISLGLVDFDFSCLCLCSEMLLILLLKSPNRRQRPAALCFFRWNKSPRLDLNVFPHTLHCLNKMRKNLF